MTFLTKLPAGELFYLQSFSLKNYRNINDIYREISIFLYMVKINYTKIAKQLKVMADPKRLKIINLLSNGEMCATDILKEFRVSQPTLSHDMKALVDGKFVIADRLGQKMFYSLNPDTIFDLQAALGNICNEDL